MSRDRNIQRGPVQPIQAKGEGMPPSGRIGWRGWTIVLGALCVLAAPGPAYSADPVSSTAKASFKPEFNFDQFTGNKPFRLNTLPTTRFGPPWADIVVRPENFLLCKGAPIALCYYSGPENSATPCELVDGQALASCTCYETPPGSPYFVDINAILNLDVYLETVKRCGHNGGDCQPRGPHVAPVCDAINKGTLIPGADLISTFSLYLEREMPVQDTTSCEKALYAGCMTAPCKRTGAMDPVTRLPRVQCACPTFDGPYEVGQDLQQTGNTCVLPNDGIWSAAYAPGQGNIFPTTPTCFPDSPGDSGCPLLMPNPPVIPAPPANVSCKDVCGEYKKSNENGVEIGFTCDATLCTATKDDVDLVEEACSGLGNTRIGEILKLELEVGFSCAASQICGCEPKKKTNEKMFSLNERQRHRGIAPQCDINGTLCGAQR